MLKLRQETFNMLLKNVLSQFFTVKCFKKLLLFRIKIALLKLLKEQRRVSISFIKCLLKRHITANVCTVFSVH